MQLPFHPSKLHAALGCLLLQCLPLSAAATQYYVAESGDDANAGTTTSAPWRDLGVAVGRLGDGDVLTVLGDYRITWPVGISKRAVTAPITINGLYTNDGAKHQILCQVSKTACIRVTSSSNLVFSNLRIDGSGGPASSLLHLQGSSRIQILNNGFTRAGAYSIWLDGWSGTDSHYVIGSNTFTNSVNTPIYLVNGNQLDVANNTVAGVSAGDGIVLVNASNSRVFGNKVSGLTQIVDKNGRDGIKLRPSTNVTVERNKVDDVTGSGIYLAAPYEGSTQRHKDIFVLRNTVTNTVLVNKGNNDPDCLGGGWPSALNASRVDGVTVEGNTVYRNHGEGITMNHATDGKVRLNNAHDNFGVNIYLNNAAKMVVDRNRAINNPRLQGYYRCGAPATGISLANETFKDEDNFVALDDIQLTNNILANSRHGINFFYDGGGHYHLGGLTNVRILNNTVYRSWKPMLEVIETHRHAGNAIQGNIWMPADTSVKAASVPAVGFDCRANLWWASAPLTSCAGHFDVAEDPLLANVTGLTAADFKITYGSPAIDSAFYSVMTPQPWWDHFGTPRTEGTPWDIGAHEFKKKAP
jgi:parallel beta-helix repeat protein